MGTSESKEFCDTSVSLQLHILGMKAVAAAQSISFCTLNYAKSAPQSQSFYAYDRQSCNSDRPRQLDLEGELLPHFALYLPDGGIQSNTFHDKRSHTDQALI